MQKFKDIEDVKKYLKSYKELKIASDRSLMKYKEMKIIKDETGGVKSTLIDGLPKGRGEISNPVESLNILIEKLEEMYIEDVTASLKRLDEIENIIICCDEKEKNVLSYHYLSLLPWEAVAEKCDCSVRSIHNKHSSALKKILNLHCFAHSDDV